MIKTKTHKHDLICNVGGLILLLLLLTMPISAVAQIFIGGNVYGGGNEGGVEGNGNVTIVNGRFGTFAAGGVTTGGNIYGGGNKGNLSGHTTVTLQGGNICGNVFGGARQANVEKYTYVNIDCANQAHDLTVNRVYGGNDISGIIGAELGGTEGDVSGLPFTPDINNGTIYVDNTFQTFVRATTERAKGVGEYYRSFVGQVFGGGNGAYDYTDPESPQYGLTAPVLDKTYLQINGGTYAYTFAGGNNATVEEDAVISINNTSHQIVATDSLNLADRTTVEEMASGSYDPDNKVDWRLLSMGVNLSTFNTGHHFNRVFGGNNTAPMAIMPRWNLTAGNIQDLYSGGNEGPMTHERGILLEIKESSTITAVNVFGGCRKADVHPLKNGVDEVNPNDIQLEDPSYKFPSGFAARVLVRGGDITNVYGGNDISGRVYGGNAVGVYTSIRGDVYGGGNGSYPYTDNASLKNDIIWGDFYYDPSTADSSVDALNAHRPNAEQVSLRLVGTEDKKTIIGGSVYVGGNSATLKKRADGSSQTVELKIGSHVIADNVFLGNNGANMVDETILRVYSSDVTGSDRNTYDFSSLNLTNSSEFATYMDGCAMNLRPTIVFDSEGRGDPADYENYTTYFGSLFGGGNVGSMVMEGKEILDFTKEVIIFNKLVGGCNNADIPATAYNAAYRGGVIGTVAERESYTDGDKMKDRLELNLSGVKLVPLRWKVKVLASQPTVGDDVAGKAVMDAQGVVTMLPAGSKAKSGVTYYDFDLNDYDQTQLEFNVFSRSSQSAIIGLDPSSLSTGTSTDDDLDRRLMGANIYGGCYNSGHVNGNVVINLNGSIHDRNVVFDEVEATAKRYGNDTYNIIARHSGVLRDEQGMDALGSALNVFGGGFGVDSEVWGSTTVNLNKGYTFQIFGGGEKGAIGKGVWNALTNEYDYSYDAKYSTCVNLNGEMAGDATTIDEKMPECEFIYGGSFEAPIAGNTQINLGNGRIFNSFAGSCNADILGHTETYMGRGSSSDAIQGFPWVLDHIYGGNDLGGTIHGIADFTGRVREAARPMIYGYNAESTPKAQVTQASSYIEYQQGRVEYIFGGAYGDYNYNDGGEYASYRSVRPYLQNAFVYFRPSVDNSNNRVERIFGAGQGISDGVVKNFHQDRSYVLVDVPQTMTSFTTTEVFGAGSFGGVGMGVTKATADENANGVEASAVIDLIRGQISAAYGGSYNQGVTRRSIVNVPTGSTIAINNVFGGAYGTSEGTADNKKPCDVYQSIVNYSSSNARVNYLYGGNNSYRRTLFTQVNVNATVTMKSNPAYLGYAYGAGYGENTWAQYTEVNINNGGLVYEAYGGGNAGKVLNEKSLDKWNAGLSAENKIGRALDGTGYTDVNYMNNSIAKVSQLFTDLNGKYGKTYAEKYNTNVHIFEGGEARNYSYGGGYGATAVVSGTTYFDVLGGKVVKDIYGAGTRGSVEDLYKDKTFTAGTNIYIKGGSVRNVYGGGWEGDVGYHNSETTETTDDVLGETHVVIGNTAAESYVNGIPVIQRNAYGAGEGGAVYGTTNITLYNGYVGYYYDAEHGEYIEKLDDETHSDGIGKDLLKEAGNIFGSGYADYSNADNAYVTIYGGNVRNSVYGGGEIGTIGRGNSDGIVHKGGESHVEMFDGHVFHDVFGGGRGFDNLNRVSAIGTSGYVFGSTDVRIHGGEVGTDAGIPYGYGNVFGGGNIGYVYSAAGVKNRGGKTDGYYYGTDDKLTEDCRVIIQPYCKVKSAYDTYAVGDFVPTSVLDTYAYNSANWDKLDNAGITIHNAVFAGGNVSAGSDRVYANAKTVFGNATASVIDLFEKDLITIGDDGIGGIYGDGNLTFVDGYRELNITNYGTDYNHLDNSLTYDQYKELHKRQQAYYELKYKAKEDHVHSYYMSTNTHSYNETLYRKGQKIEASVYASMSSDEQNNWKAGHVSYTKDEQITENEFDLMDATEQANWDLYGFCTLFEGRMMNTIQRADFCGVFGSRIVLRGAQDRVPSEVDYTEYTINRIDELSLNKITNTSVSKTNGNYFGIYNVVNLLGALTSDVDFKETVRETESTDYPADGKTLYQWKQANLGKRSRNNGKCHNEVSLASGVWLEILDKATETAGKKVYGPITGVVQLNLINVATGEGGGYVYAKNQHGELISKSATGQNTLADANDNAISYKQFTYKTTDLINMETSGNFINPLKRIVDDCYPRSGAYKGEGASPAHYWFIRGEYYVYDQYISAYTGSTQAYAEMVSIPLTISAEAQGKLELESVYKNLYAYWDDETLLPKYKSKVDENAIIVGGVTYHKNQPISYWNWAHLTDAEKELFVSDETFVCSNTATYNNVTYTAGDVFITKPADIYVCVAHDDNTYPEGTVITAAQYEELSEIDQSKFELVFNRSNVVSHSNGFVLTVDWDNPDVWNDYYHQQIGTGKEPSSKYNTIPSGYITSPSYICTTSGVYGQRKYSEGDLIGKAYYDQQSALGTHTPSEGQGQFDEAYVAKDNCQFTDHATNYQYVKGACIRKQVYDALEESNKAYFDAGMICNDTYSKSETEYYLYGEVIPLSEYNDLLAVDASVSNNFSKGYICYQSGLWGGEYYTENTNYSAIKFSNLNEAERSNFTFNYDAFDVLIDENYLNNTALYDSQDGSAGKILYAKRQSIDYEATYRGAGIKLTNEIDFTRNGNPMHDDDLVPGDVLQNTAYESLVNYQYNYTPIVVVATDIRDYYYVVKERFQVGDRAYLVGNQLSATEYAELSEDNKLKIQAVSKEALAAIDALPTGTGNNRYYFCNNQYTSDADHSIGELISTTTYSSLKNEQIDFEIDGLVPSETSTLYVAREANIDELSQDRIITVTYWYDYIEKDDSGLSYENIREKHVVNIHVHFESGVPTIGELLPPATVLPSDVLSLNQPTVSKGAYEILGGGWEIFTNEDDAVKHQNGEHYTNYITPMYWYQNEYYVSYYAKSYLGKTYSNPVKISVANYHNIDDVMNDKDHHMYVDHPNVKRNSKIYIDDADCLSDGEKSKLDLLKDLYDLSLLTTPAESGELVGHAILDEHVKSCADLDFILRGDVAPKKYTDWTPIGNDTGTCFAGTVHGDGYTVSGLNNSLFNQLCGDIYNLGVTGTFTGAGIAETGAGYMENCWAATTSTAAKTSKPVFGTPTGTGYQMVNCYYMEDDDATYKYTNHSGNYGIPTRKTSQAFYNGEVAYDLNGFYLYKRYNDGKGVSTGTEYKYYTFASDGTISAPQTGHYESHVSECSSGGAGKYVEDRFANNDFIYAAGNIPEGENVRYSVDDDKYYPIWPDDYVFFGQMLTYGHVDDQAHQSLPSHIIKAADRIQIAKGNRVYRAPAYFQSKQMGIAHFNPDAILAAKSKDKTRDAYPGMTAIDFSGYNDLSHGYQLGAKSTAPYDNIRDGGFYPPLLDDDGLHSIANMDLTKNLLVYIPQATTEATTKTYDVVTDYLPDATYAETNATYRTVATSTATINGHRVEDTGEGYTAPVDHLLVDKQDFNAPISYTFASGKRMWYQRRPDLYVNTNRGWEGISIPFAAELVTTQDKGEITHFYETSTSGHEYWLRGLVSGGEISTENAAIYLAKFEYPKKGSVTKDYTNTFLWDYYYSKYDRKDANTDKYQQEDDRQKYYIESRTYENYPYNGAATPYIIGFPSNRYYEFDLSGSFIPENTFNSIDRLPQQTITFASKPAITIAVSDDEMASAATSDTKYIFTPNYLSKLQGAGVFMMNGEGNAYQVTEDPTAAVPFRPYFVSAPSSAKRFKAAQYIVFDEGVSFDIESPFVEEKSEPMAEELDEGELTFFGQGHNIISKSSLTRDADVHIYNTNGVIIANFTIHADETISLPASAGVYIINADRGRVVKKLIVK